MHQLSETIIAPATGSGGTAIGVIRLSGPLAIQMANTFFRGKSLEKLGSGRTAYGLLVGKEDTVVDEVVVTVFRAPASYTRQDTVEISCHGSSYIIESIIRLFVDEGALMADPGEFTYRAFLNGRMDLSQAEAVADLIASSNASQHQIALNQMKGGLSKKLKGLRTQLIDFASLIELENDFAEEDVEFADRRQLKELCSLILDQIKGLIGSFREGNAIKNGIPVAIVGKPNVGKSTLLNALLDEDRAIVSSIPGTTRDVIEDTFVLSGYTFRLIDTAGIRQTEDEIEKAGIERTKSQINKASVILYVDDISSAYREIAQDFKELPLNRDQHAIVLLNKSDQVAACDSIDVEEAVSTLCRRISTIAISALEGGGIDRLQKALLDYVKSLSTGNEVVISNLRHEVALQEVKKSLEQVTDGLKNNLPSDLIALDIRHALHHLGSITGEISTDDLLGNIFANFCIGK